MLALAIILLIILVVGWHLFFPIVGGIIAISALAWIVIMASIVALCIAIMLLFVFTGIGAFILGAGAFVWVLLAIIFFPILFPILAPLFIILLFIAYVRRKHERNRLR